MQEHANAMTRPIISVYFSYYIILMGSLDVYHILYTQPIRAGMGSPDSSHTAGSFFLLGEPALVALLMPTPIKISNRHNGIM